MPGPIDHELRAAIGMRKAREVGRVSVDLDRHARSVTEHDPQGWRSLEGLHGFRRPYIVEQPLAGRGTRDDGRSGRRRTCDAAS